MAKGTYGESCPEAIRFTIQESEILTFTEFVSRIKSRGSWKDETIWQNLISHIVNLPPARMHWKSSRPFLFLHADGRYELFDKRKHPQPII